MEKNGNTVLFYFVNNSVLIILGEKMFKALQHTTAALQHPLQGRINIFQMLTPKRGPNFQGPYFSRLD